MLMKRTCCLCGDFPAVHNAAPVAEGFCCEECHRMIVLPIRLILAARERKEWSDAKN